MRPDRRDAVWLGVAAAAVLAIAAVSMAAGGEVSVVARFSGAVGGMQERLLAWQAALAAVAARPLLGWGPDTFIYAFRAMRPAAYATAFGADSTINNAHDWPLQTAATLGIGGALLLVAAVASALWSTGRRALGITKKRYGLGAKGTSSATRKAAPKGREATGDGGADTGDDLVYLGLWVAAVGFSLHMLLSVAYLGSTVPFWILLGAACAPVARDHGEGTARAWWAAAAAGVLLLGALWGAGALLGADHDYLMSRLTFRGLVAGDSVSWAQDATRANPMSVKYARGYADALSEAFYRGSQETSAGTPAVRQAYERADEAFRQALTLHPADYPGWAWRAAMQATAGWTLSDQAIVDAAGRSAATGAKLDRDAVQVRRLASGA